VGEEEVTTEEEAEDAEESASEEAAETEETEEAQEVRTETDPLTGEEQEVDDAGQVVPVPLEEKDEEES
jgi:hypothetical protein